MLVAGNVAASVEEERAITFPATASATDSDCSVGIDCVDAKVVVSCGRCKAEAGRDGAPHNEEGC